MADDLILALDGGGSRSRGRLYAPDGAALGEAEAGPLNPSSDRDGAVASAEAIRAALAPQAPPGRLTLALAAAGLRQPEKRGAFLALLPPFARVVTMTDGYAALIGASGGVPSGLVILGTGAVAHRLYEDGTSVQRDGWGWFGGDRGSGAWIGRKAARHLCAVRDRVEPAGPLAARLEAVLGRTDEDVLAWLLSATQARLAQLAPLVVAAAEEGDETASLILDRAAGHAAALALCLDLGPDEPLYFTGGLLPALRARVAARLDRPFATPEHDAVHGAFLVATGAAPPEVFR